MKTSCWFAMTLAASAQVAVAFTIDHDFPAGNVIVDSIEGDTAKARQDMLDTKYSWFYWAFRVKGAKGKTVRFVFTDKYGGGPVGVRGPVVSTDGGKTFAYPLDGKAKNEFAYTPRKDFKACHATEDVFSSPIERRRGSRWRSVP